MTSAEPARLRRLRAELELKTEMVRALRRDQERQRELATQDAALVAEVLAEIQRMSQEARDLLAESDAAAARKSLLAVRVLCDDLADLCAARAGSLAVVQEPVSIRRLMARLAGAYELKLRLATLLPEWIDVDERVLARLLHCLVENSRAAAGAILEVAPEAGDDVVLEGLVPITFRLISPPLPGDGPDTDGSVTGRLRQAFMMSVCRFMDGASGQDWLTLPCRVAQDPAQTGVMRLRLEGPDLVTRRYGGAADAAFESQFGTVPSPSDDAIDLLYLERQLGSLAAALLQQTAPAFVSQAPVRMMSLQVAIETADLDRVRLIVRGWKGCALTVGARSLAALLESMERQLCRGHLPSETMLWQLRLCVDRVIRSLAAPRAWSMPA